MPQTKIKCPNCGVDVNVDEVFKHQAEEYVRKEYEEKFSKQLLGLNKQREEVESEKFKVKKLKEEQDDIIRRKLFEEKDKIRVDAEFKAKKELEFEMFKLKQDYESKTKENFQLKKKEVEILNKERELVDKEIQLKLDMEKQLMDKTKMIEERAIKQEKERNELKNREYEKQLEEQKVVIDIFKKKEVELLNKEKELKERDVQLRSDIEKQMITKAKEIEEKIVRREQEKNELKKREYEKQLEDQKRLINELKKKAEQGSILMQAEVQELALEEFLKNNFPFDIIDEVIKGIKGADVIHIVRNDLQQECGKIIYESKRTKGFSELWIAKIKDDQKIHQADIGVIVTESMPRDMERFGLRHGVWICSYPDIKSLSMVLREMLLKTHLVRSAQENKGEKMEMLYGYLTSNEFRYQIEAIIDAFTCLKTELDKEKRAMQRIWKEREKQIEKVFTNTIDMYGAVKGIAGNAVQSIKTLELPPTEEEM